MFPSAGHGGKDMPNATTPVGNSSVQVAFRKALKTAGINKKATVHTLRHHADSLIMPTPLRVFPHPAVIPALFSILPLVNAA